MGAIVRLLNTTLDGTKSSVAALANVKGIGVPLARAILRKAGIRFDKRLMDLTEEEIRKIEEIARDPLKYGIPGWMLNRHRDPHDGKSYLLLGDEVTLAEKKDIALMKRIKCWKGIRHSLGLKVRGQRTRTTGRRGRTVGYKKKK